MSLKLIVALDFDNKKSALDLVEQLDPKTCALKVGSELFTLFGPDFVSALIKKDFKVFLDLKFHDIPTTVARACKASGDLGVWMLNVHACGGLEMMQAAKKPLEPFGDSRPLLIAVTVLTSMAGSDLPSIGVKTFLPSHIQQLAGLARDAALDGVVCAGADVASIKATCGQSFLAVTPGIRFSLTKQDDQTRIMTPQQALQEGSDYLVIGRPITRAKNPMHVVQTILSSNIG